MNPYIEKLQRQQRLHHLIRRRATGCPDTLARKLNTSRATVYRDIDTLKSRGASIAYCRQNTTFYYESPYQFPTNLIDFI